MAVTVAVVFVFTRGRVVPVGMVTMMDVMRVPGMVVTVSIAHACPPR
jgi:hypothetical protein